MKQSDIVKQLTDKQLKQQLVLSQLLLIVLSILLSLFLFDNITDWLTYVRLDINSLYWGILAGAVIVIIDVMLMYIFPEKYYDDGGINHRIFKNRSIRGIFGIALLVAVSEELLFRGVIQTVFGYLPASILFALVHIRYLKKPVLFLSVLFISFYIGYLFVLSENLLVTIIAHFTVDFVLGIIIRFQK